MGDLLQFSAPKPEEPPSEHLTCKACGGTWWQTETDGGAIVLTLTNPGIRVTGMYKDLVCGSCGLRLPADQIWRG